MAAAYLPDRLASAAAAVIFGTCCTARIGEISGANGGAAAMGALLARQPPAADSE